MSFDESPDILSGGAWVSRRGILVWVPTEAPEAEPAPNNVRALRVSDLIACPTCEARLDQPCTTAEGGYRKKSHKTRLIRRRCSCGEPVRRGTDICTDCRTDRDRGLEVVA